MLFLFKNIIDLVDFDSYLIKIICLSTSLSLPFLCQDLGMSAYWFYSCLYMSISLFVCLSISLSVCLSVSPPVYLSVYLPVYLFVSPHSLSTSLSVHIGSIAIYQFISLSVCPFVCLSVHQFFCLSISLSPHLSLYLPACPTICLPVSQSVLLSISKALQQFIDVIKSYCFYHHYKLMLILSNILTIQTCLNGCSFVIFPLLCDIIC